MAKAQIEHPVSLQNTNIEPNTKVGRYTYFRRGCTLVQGCEVGRYCAIARDVEIGAHEHPTDWLSVHTFQYDYDFFRDIEGYRDHKRIKRPMAAPAIIGHDVWIGAKAIIRRGVKVGHGAIIGAGSFVNRDVPPYAIVAGSPARLIRYRFDAETVARLLKIEWWNLLPSQLDGIRFDNIEMALEQLEARTADLAALPMQNPDLLQELPR